MNDDILISGGSDSCVLVTGGTGFAGSHLVELLASTGMTNIHVTAFSRGSSAVSSFIPQENIHSLDLTDFQSVSALINQVKPTQIYHLASAAGVGSSFEQTQSVLENHLKLQLNLLEAVKNSGLKAKILSIGSALEYQPANFPLKETDPLGPVSPYAVSKVIQDMLSHSYAVSYDMNIVQVRPFNHIGERQGLGFVVPDFAKQIIDVESGRSSQIEVGNLTSIRDFTDVKDTVRAYALLMEKGESAQVYNVGSGVGYSMQQILDWLIAESSVSITIHTDLNHQRPLDQAQVVADNAKIRSLGWAPTIPIQQTLKRVMNWWRTKS